MSAFTSFFSESYDELMNKVTWPTMSELQSQSVLVFIASLIIALLIFGMDYVFGVQSSNWFDAFTWKGILGFIYDIIL